MPIRIDKKNVSGEGSGGVDLPLGGKAGQVLTKQSNLDNDIIWADIIHKKEIEFVSELPTEDISLEKIYIFNNSINYYDGEDWHNISSTEVDLSNYYNKSETDNLLDNKVNKITGKQLSTEDFTTELKVKLESTEIITSEDMERWDNKSDFSGNYNDLINTPNALPADGGNADTVDGKHAIDFAEAEHIHSVVTTENDGFMSKDDKIKLNTIENNANYYVHPETHPVSIITGLATVATTGDYNDLMNKPTIGTDMTPSDILEALKEVDGTGSELDADTVDGKHASDFAEVIHSHDDYVSIQDIDITVTVGDSGDFNTINEAIAYLTTKRMKHLATSIKAEIKLLSGFIMNEQIYVNGENLGWITITAEDSVVIINRESITQTYGSLATPGYGSVVIGGAFVGINNAILPVINVLFEMNETGNAQYTNGFFVANGAQLTILPGCGCRNGQQGIYVIQGGRVIANGADVSYAKGNAISCFRGAYVNFAGGDGSHAGGHGVYLDNGCHANCASADFSNSGNYGLWISSASVICFRNGKLSNCTHGIIADHCSLVDADGATIDNSTQRGVTCSYATISVVNASIQNSGTDGINCAGGTVYATGATITGSGGKGIFAVYGARVVARQANAQKGETTSSDDIRVLEGSIIVANGATGGTSQTINTITENGIIFG